MSWIKRYKRFFYIIFSIWLILFLLSLNAGPKTKDTKYGVTFSPQQAKSLGLDWRAVYEDMLTDLNVKLVRVSAYWNEIEKEQGSFDFSDLDFQLDMAKQHGAEVVLSVGRRLPRWPECHDPSWLKGLSQEQQDNALLSMIETVVVKYYNHEAIKIWQVENEPFLDSFGECPQPRPELLDKEIALVEKLDPVRPILISDSGELSLWLKAGKRGDMFGTTLYRFVYSDVFNRYWVNYIPYWFYRVKWGFLRLFERDKQIAIIELQAEPWTTKGILSTPIEEQFKTMSMAKFESIMGVAKSTGFSPQYLWGVEWWYWMKTQNHPEFWDKAKSLF